MKKIISITLLLALAVADVSWLRRFQKNASPTADSFTEQCSDNGSGSAEGIVNLDWDSLFYCQLQECRG